MDDEAFNLSLRKFLKTVGVGSQREIEEAAARAVVAGSIGDAAALPATMILRVPGLQLEVRFDGELRLR
jgi:hypothetical protein